MSNDVEVLVFNKSGIDPLHIEPEIRSITWRLNHTGRAQCYMAYSDPECTPDNLALGNRMLFRFENGLTAFGGVIDVPRTRTSTGVAFNVYGGARILGWRRTGTTKTFSSTAPGTIFQTLIEDVNSTWVTGIAIGTIYIGTARSETYHYTNVLEAILQLARQTGEEFEIIPVYQGGCLTFLANWRDELGTDVSEDALLVEDKNIRPPTLDEQGPIASRVILVGGAGGTTSWENRKTSEDNDTTSQNAYSYREFAKIESNIIDQSTLDTNVDVLADEMNTPRSRYTLAALDREPAGFGEYNVGDTVALHAFLADSDWAVDTTVRIFGREWTPDNVCRLEVK